MWGETIWAISARAELGLGIAGFSSDSSPISLAPCAVAAKKSLQNIRDAIEHERVVLPPYKTVGCPHSGGGIPLFVGMDSGYLAVPCSSGQLLSAAFTQKIEERKG